MIICSVNRAVLPAELLMLATQARQTVVWSQEGDRLAVDTQRRCSEVRSLNVNMHFRTWPKIGN